MDLRVSWMSPCSKDGGGKHVRGAKSDRWETNGPDRVQLLWQWPFTLPVLRDVFGTWRPQPTCSSQHVHCSSRSMPSGHWSGWLITQSRRDYLRRLEGIDSTVRWPNIQLLLPLAETVWSLNNRTLTFLLVRPLAAVSDFHGKWHSSVDGKRGNILFGRGHKE